MKAKAHLDVGQGESLAPESLFWQTLLLQGCLLSQRTLQDGHWECVTESELRGK